MSENLIIGGCFTAVGALIVALFVLIVHESHEWERFSAAHACKVVAHVRGDVFNTVGVDAKGNVSVGIGSTPDKTGWLCDDGVTYYR